MKTVVVFVGVVVLGVVCQAAQSSSCTLARQFTATLTSVKTLNSPTIHISHLALDMDRKVEVLNLTSFDPSTGQTTFTGRTLIDFAQKRQYYMPADNPSACTHFPSSLALPDILPANVTNLGSGNIGPAGALPYFGVRFPWQPDMTVTFLMSTEGCVPIVQGVSSTNPASPVDEIFLYSNYATGIPDSSVFDLPDSCSN